MHNNQCKQIQQTDEANMKLYYDMTKDKLHLRSGGQSESDANSGKTLHIHCRFITPVIVKHVMS